MIRRFLPILPALCVCFALVGSVQAAPIVLTMQDWYNNPQQQDQDKLYTLDVSNTNLPSTLALTITTVPIGPFDVHSITVGSAASPIGSDVNYVLQYTIEITDPGVFFASVGLDVDTQLTGQNVRKLVSDNSFNSSNVGSLVSTDGSAPDDLNVSAGQYTKLWITESFLATGNSAIVSSTNTYIQDVSTVRNLPEPSSLFCFAALGLVGGVLTLRRRK